MRIMIFGVEKVRIGIGHVVDFEFLQSSSQWFAVLEFDRKVVRLEFETA